MSNWPDKYVIGLTGNIATGKSVVRRMLEHLGAYSIDADKLAHRTIARGAPGYQPVIENFGKFIVGPDGEIDRAKLGRIVFSDPDALRTLENIVHPLVRFAMDILIQRAAQRVIVIEAIKLLEGKLAGACDSIWVTVSPENVQMARLTQKRGLSQADAIQRIRAQSAQELKTSAAHVVINNTGSFEDTWKQVLAAWKEVSQVTDTLPVVIRASKPGEVSVQRGRPRDSARIAELITRLSDGHQTLSPSDVMAAYGEKAFMLLLSDDQLVGLAGWQVENLVARTTEMYIDPSLPLPKTLKTLVAELERASQDLQCEASLIFLQPKMASQEDIWKELGYVQRTPQTLGVPAWQDAAYESQPPNSVLYFKQLRQDRILRPI